MFLQCESTLFAVVAVAVAKMHYFVFFELFFILLDFVLFLVDLFLSKQTLASHGEADAVSVPTNASCIRVCVWIYACNELYDCVCDLGNVSSIYSVSICGTNQFNLIQIPNGWIQLKFKERLQFYMFAINRKIVGNGAKKY